MAFANTQDDEQNLSSHTGPIPFQAIQSRLRSVGMDVDLDLVQYMKGCNDRFEKNPEEAVVIFTKVDNPKQIEEAFELWGACPEVGNKVMVTKYGEFVIYELATDIHKAMTSDVICVLQHYFTSAFGKDMFLECQPFVRFESTCRLGIMEGDGRFKRMICENNQVQFRTTAVVKVAWTQNLFGDDKSLMAKAHGWIKQQASLVIAVKLYGYNCCEDPGMLVCLVNQADGVFEVADIGTIPTPENDLMNMLNDYNAAAPFNNDNNRISEIQDISDTGELGIEGRYLLGVDENNWRGEMNEIINTLRTSIDNDMVPFMRKYMERAVQLAIHLRDRDDILACTIDFWQFYWDYCFRLQSSE